MDKDKEKDVHFSSKKKKIQRIPNALELNGKKKKQQQKPCNNLNSYREQLLSRGQV